MMRGALLSLLALLALAAPTAAEDPAPVPAAEGLIGTWRVDLRPTPEAEAYYQPFVVRAIDGDTFEGTFYGTEIRHGRLNTDWGAVYFAFVTNDGSGDYHTSGRWDGDELRGTTHSLGREFLAVWTAERIE